MHVDLSILIVNWNVRDLLRDCLRSVLMPMSFDADSRTWRLGARHVEILVVDNASGDGSAAMVRAEFPDVSLIACDANLGFVGGNNLALERARGDYLLLLNPDAMVVGDAVEALMSYMDAHPEVGIAGPLLRSVDGAVQSSRRRFPTLWQALWESTVLEQWFPHNPWARRYRMEDMPAYATQNVDWVTGACLIVRARAAAEVGPLDAHIFMYSEELDWCRRMADAGWRVAFVPEAQVVHYEGRSSTQVAVARQIYFDSSKIYYFRKHHGALQAEVLRALLLAGHAVQLLEEGLKCAAGHKPALRRERMAAYARILRSGLRMTSEGGAPHG